MRQAAKCNARDAAYAFRSAYKENRGEQADLEGGHCQCEGGIIQHGVKGGSKLGLDCVHSGLAPADPDAIGIGEELVETCRAAARFGGACLPVLAGCKQHHRAAAGGDDCLFWQSCEDKQA